MPVSVADFFRVQFHPFACFTSSGILRETGIPQLASGIGF